MSPKGDGGLTDEVFRTGQPLIYEDSNRGHYFINHVSPIFDAAGTVTTVAIIAFDITDRKQAEDSLREADELNRQIIASANDGLIVMDREYRYQVWNPAMEQISGIRSVDLMGKRPHEMFPFLKDVGIIAMLERAQNGETLSSPDFPYQVSASGREGWASQSMGPLRSADGAIVGVIATVRDVTERIQAEKSLRESEARYRTLVEHAPEAIVVLDVDRRAFVEINENACRLFDMSREEMMRHGPIELSPPRQPDGRTSIESGNDRIEKALAGESQRFEWTHRDALGRDIPCEVFLVRLLP